jgi:hypothetical protein
MRKIIRVRRNAFMPQLSEEQMLQAMGSNIDAFNGNVDHANGGAPMLTPPTTQPRLGSTAGNPNFAAQFDIQVVKKYFTEAAGVYTAATGGTIAANLRVSLPYVVFGLSDFDGGYARILSEIPVNTNDWVQGDPFIYGKGSTIEIPIDSTVKAQLRRGDMVIPFTSALPGAGTTTLALIIVRSSQVAFGTLLKSLASDYFAINLLRFFVPDSTSVNLAQYQNDILLFTQSLFGKVTSDSISPNSSKVPEQQQANIIDIPLDQVVNKANSLAGYINYDVDSFSWSIFVSYFKKLAQ